MNISAYFPYIILILSLIISTYITQGYFKALANELNFDDISIITGGFCLFAVVLATGSTISGFIRFLLICLTAGYTTSALYFRDELPIAERTDKKLLTERDDYGRLNLILIVGLSIAVIIFPIGPNVPRIPIIGATLLMLVVASMGVIALSQLVFRNRW